MHTQYTYACGHAVSHPLGQQITGMGPHPTWLHTLLHLHPHLQIYSCLCLYIDSTPRGTYTIECCTLPLQVVPLGNRAHRLLHNYRLIDVQRATRHKAATRRVGSGTWHACTHAAYLHRLYRHNVYIVPSPMHPSHFPKTVIDQRKASQCHAVYRSQERLVYYHMALKLKNIVNNHVSSSLVTTLLYYICVFLYQTSGGHCSENIIWVTILLSYMCTPHIHIRSVLLID